MIHGKTQGQGPKRRFPDGLGHYTRGCLLGTEQHGLRANPTGFPSQRVLAARKPPLQLNCTTQLEKHLATNERQFFTCVAACTDLSPGWSSCSNLRHARTRNHRKWPSDCLNGGTYHLPGLNHQLHTLAVNPSTAQSPVVLAEHISIHCKNVRCVHRMFREKRFARAWAKLPYSSRGSWIRSSLHAKVKYPTKQHLSRIFGAQEPFNWTSSYAIGSQWSSI